MLAYVELTKIAESRRPLRIVNKRSIEYRELVSSMRKDGLLQPILVRPFKKGKYAYEVVEGGHRYNAAKEIGWDTIACYIRELSDYEVSVIQLKAQAIRPEMIKSDFAARLEEIVTSGVATLTDLAAEIGKSAVWVRDMMHLTKLTPEAQRMVDRGEIPIGSAKMLSRLPRGLQEQLVDHAVILTTAEFNDLARQHLKNYREAIKKGRIDNMLLRQLKPQPYLRSMRELREEAAGWKQAGIHLKMQDAKTPLDGWRACLIWLLHLDPLSLKEHEEKFIRARAEKLNAIERRKADKVLKRNLLGEDEDE